MSRANEDIRRYAKERNVYLWEVAQKVECNDGNFSRKLRKELSEAEKMTVFCAIDDIVECHHRDRAEP